MPWTGPELSLPSFLWVGDRGPQSSVVPLIKKESRWVSPVGSVDNFLPANKTPHRKVGFFESISQGFSDQNILGKNII
jgi:hypothetical protein